jgi:hypothetical protein
MQCIPDPGMLESLRHIAMLLPLRVKAFLSKYPFVRKLVEGTCASRALLEQIVV